MRQLTLPPFSAHARFHGRPPPERWRRAAQTVVFIVVDQMRADYPVRYAGLLQQGLKG